jgi:hypothetical protein
MKKNTWFEILYSARHIIAILCAIIGFLVIKQISLVLYIKPYQALSVLEYCQLLWHSTSLFLQMILIFNIVIKPMFIYFLVILLFYLFKKS